MKFILKAVFVISVPFLFVSCGSQVNNSAKSAGTHEEYGKDAGQEVTKSKRMKRYQFSPFALSRTER